MLANSEEEWQEESWEYYFTRLTVNRKKPFARYNTVKFSSKRVTVLVQLNAKQNVFWIRRRWVDLTIRTDCLSPEELVKLRAESPPLLEENDKYQTEAAQCPEEYRARFNKFPSPG